MIMDRHDLAEHEVNFVGKTQSPAISLDALSRDLPDDIAHVYAGYAS